MNIFSIFSDITCGEACWYAKEDVCKCSCGGKNHGCLRTSDGHRPTRTAKIDGERYELVAVGKNLYSEAAQLTQGLGWQSIEHFEAWSPLEDSKTIMSYHHSYDRHGTTSGAVIRLKPASKAQIANWPELAAFQDIPRYEAVYLLWIRLEVPKQYRCAHDCQKCAEKYQEIAAVILPPQWAGKVETVTLTSKYYPVEEAA